MLSVDDIQYTKVLWFIACKTGLLSASGVDLPNEVYKLLQRQILYPCESMRTIVILAHVFYMI